ncbi:ATPase [Lactobacillus helveticus]|uniref:ATPase n=1 Tax=Lactobacillus helveticus TaxID=1587 RepID=UPI00197B3583|nr:ATPase [Lactobacillus helveticus]MBN6050094.1 ATPase [Lactobacillus helveticus]
MRIEISEIKYCLQNKQSFNLETTLNGSSKYFFNLITKAKNNGFKVHLYYVGLSSVYLALDRVKARVKKVAMEWMKI